VDVLPGCDDDVAGSTFQMLLFSDNLLLSYPNMSKRRGSLNSPNPIKQQCEDLLTQTASLSENVEPSQLKPCDAPGSTPGNTASLESPPASHAVDVVAASSVPLSPGSPGCNRSAFESPPAINGGCVVGASSVPLSPGSPGSNRAAFLSKLVPSRVMCNLDLSRSPPGSKVAVSAVVIAVFDANSNPDRRYVQVADATGSLGLTVWNGNVAKLSRSSIGQVIKVGKAVIGSHQGKKVLTLTRESTLEFDAEHPLHQWWKDLAQQPPVSLSATLDIADNCIVNVAGVLGMVASEEKMVGTVVKTLVTLHLADPTGQLDIRSWNHSASFFEAYVEQPILICRIRMSSFAGMRMGELLANDASCISTEFPAKKALQNYWAN
jgi:hypothetical protein